jgi:hypothetical protein
MLQTKCFFEISNPKYLHLIFKYDIAFMEMMNRDRGKGLGVKFNCASPISAFIPKSCHPRATTKKGS